MASPRAALGTCDYSEPGQFGQVRVFRFLNPRIVAIPTYEGLRPAMRLVGFKSVAEVIRPGLGPTGERREFLEFAR